MDCKINFNGESDEKWKKRENSIWVKVTLFLSEESIEVIQKKKQHEKSLFFPLSFWLQDPSKT